MSFCMGFSASPWQLITIDALLWYGNRMLIGSLIINCLYIIRKFSVEGASISNVEWFLEHSCCLLHWVTFFAMQGFKYTVSLATMSTELFFYAFLEPFWYTEENGGLWIFSEYSYVGPVLCLGKTDYLLGILWKKKFLGGPSPPFFFLCRPRFSLINGKLTQLT